MHNNIGIDYLLIRCYLKVTDLNHLGWCKTANRGHVRDISFRKTMVDLGLCGLFVCVILFLTPAVIYITLGLTCSVEHAPSEFCWNVTQQTAVVLIAFGFVFFIFGLITCVFTMVIWNTSGNSSDESCEDEDKERMSDFVWVLGCRNLRPYDVNLEIDRWCNKLWWEKS